MRPDHKIMRSIYEWDGLKVLMDYQRAPLIDLRGTDWSKRGAKAKLFSERVRFGPPVWKECVFFVSMRVDVGPPLDTGLWVHDVGGDEVVLTACTAIGGGYVSCLVNTVSAEIQMSGREHRSKRSEDAYPQAGEAISWIYSGVSLWLNECSDHPVEVIDAPQSRLRKKINTKKPWLRDDLPRTIMLDLTSAKRYGHPNRGGTHASPHPHQRRGHFKTLRAERFGENRGKRIWTRPAWVGDREWIYNGATYKVLDLPTEATQ